MAFQPHLQVLPGPNFNPLAPRSSGVQVTGTREGRARLRAGCASCPLPAPLPPRLPPPADRPSLSPTACPTFTGPGGLGQRCLVLQTRKRIDLGGKLQRPPDDRQGRAGDRPGDSRLWVPEQWLQGRPRRGAQASLRRAHVRSPRQLGSPTSTVPVPPRAGHFLRAGH